MTHDECIDLIVEKIMSVDTFHFLRYHAVNTYFVGGAIHPIIDSLSLALSTIDSNDPGYALEIINRICSYKGESKDNYDQILSIFAEVSVAFRAIEIANSVNETKVFVREPKKSKTSKNPEFSSKTLDIGYCAEVKAPKIRKHQEGRISGFQFTSRSDTWMNISKEMGGNVILPKDNPIKDYLESADRKFVEYKKLSVDDFRILFIIWDDYIYEPMNALLHPLSGLFTDQSFYKDKNNNIILFSNVDGVIITRQMMYFQQVLADKRPIDPIDHPFSMNNDLPNIFVQNPHGRQVPIALYEEFNATPPHPMLGSEYGIVDIVFWL